MVQVDIYTIITLLMAVALAVMGIELALKNIPRGGQFIKLRMMKWLMSSAYLVTAAFAVVEFIFWDTFQHEVAAFLNMASAAYQYVLLTALLTTCFNPAFTNRRRLILWLGMTTAWALPLGILTFIGETWTVYAVSVIYLIQLTVGGTMFYRNFKEDIKLIQSADTHHKFDSRWMRIGIFYLYFYCIAMFVITWMPPVVHIVFTILTIIIFIVFASRFSTFAGRIFQEDYPILTAAGLTDALPEETDNYKAREEFCRKAVEEWVAARGYTKGELSREETAADMGLDEADLKWYFAVCLKEDIRSWRVNLRIDYAKEILRANPDAPINELAKAVGFTSRNNIYTYFRKYYGMTPKEYGLEMQRKDSQ